MKKYLGRKDRVAIYKEMTREQRKAMFSVIGKSYRSYFAEVLAKYKGTKDWTFHLYIDHGRRRDDIRCECGKKLRHQYILINKKTGKKRTIGSTHFVEELNIPENIAKEVLQGITDINYDLDELLQKYKMNWELPKHIQKNLNKIEVPNDIKRLLQNDLPLLWRQVDLLHSRCTRLNNSKVKAVKVITRNLSGGSVEFEIENEEIYKVLVGDTDAFSYIGRFREDIDTFIKGKRNYIPIYDLINHLIGKGLPNQLMYGKHALTDYFSMYLGKRSDKKFKIKRDNYGNPLFKLDTNRR